MKPSFKTTVLIAAIDMGLFISFRATLYKVLDADLDNGNHYVGACLYALMGKQ